MNTLVWKLLRQHISIGQLAGFFLANLFGMMIVLLSVQFYKDVIPVFTEGDSFMKKDFIIATKKISTLGSFAGKSNTFSPEDIADLKKQSFTKTIGAFTPSQFKVSAGLGMQKAGIHLSTDMFFESVPDEFVDIKLDKWHFDEETHTIPIIIPRNYLNLYNFGFAQSRSLPKLSEGLMGLIQMDIMMRGNGRVEQYKGNIVGFSNRLNTILVPQSFMNWANKNFAPDAEAQPARLIIEVSNPADSSIASYFQKKGYETEDGKLDAGKTTYFLRLIVGIVLGVGLFISILSFYILMLSIFLLLQKNTTKLESLLLIGYSPNRVALPYQILTVGLNIIVLILSVGLVCWLRSYYIESIRLLFPQLETGSLWVAVSMGILLFLIVSVINILAVKRKVLSIWMHKKLKTQYMKNTTTLQSKRSITVLLGVLLYFSSLSAQTMQDTIIANFSLMERIPKEKLYLHLDKPFYGAGEKIWFKGYLVNAITHQDNAQSNFIITELINRSDSIVERKKIRRDSLGFHNAFTLPATLPAGDYYLRGYSNWMLNEDPDFFFSRNIKIGNSIDNTIVSSIEYQQEDDTHYTAKIKFTSNVQAVFENTTIKYLYLENGKIKNKGKKKDGRKRLDFHFPTRFKISGSAQNRSRI